MSRIFLISFLSLVSMVTSVMGQCAYPAYESYGLTCGEARYLCGYEMDGYVGRLRDEKSPQPQPDPLCNGGDTDNIQWFSFLASDSIVEIKITYSDCVNNILIPGLQVGIFENCDLNSDMEPLGSIYCFQDYNYRPIFVRPDTSDIKIGRLYLLFIDGYAGSTCDFEIEVIQGICTDPPGLSVECEQDCGLMSPYGTEGCTMFQDTFSFIPAEQIMTAAGMTGCDLVVTNTQLDSIICVEWDIQPSTGFNIISSSFDYFDNTGAVPTLIVEWLTPGTYTIQPIINFNPLFSTCQPLCDCTNDVVFTIDIAEGTLVNLPDLVLCPDECLDFCGQTYCDSGEYKCYDRDACLIGNQNLIVEENIFIDEGLIYLCPGECYDFQSVSYCDQNIYAITDVDFCDTTYVFQIVELAFEVDFLSTDDLIDCDNSTATLIGEWNTNYTGNTISAWISESGDTLTYDDEYIATEGGEYTFVVWPENVEKCKISLTHTVVQDTDIPTADLDPPSLDCNNPTDVINVNTLDDIATITWDGPNGYTSSVLNTEVIQGGIYMVTITEENGCTLVLSTEVIEDFEDPEIEVFYEDLICSEDIPSSSFTTTSNIVSQEWILPDGSVSFEDDLILSQSGNYALEVTASNGCTVDESFVVLDLTYDPSLHLVEDRIWRCTDTEIVLDLRSQEVQGLSYVWQNIEGAILSNSINLSIVSPGVYILTTEDQNIGCIGSDTVRILEDPNPFVDVELSILSPLCFDGIDGTVEIVTIEGGGSPYTYFLNDKEVDDFSEIDFEPGFYHIDVIDVFGCVVSKDIEVPTAKEIVIMEIPELSIRYGETKPVTFDINLEDSEIGLIEWTTEDGEYLGDGRELDFIGQEIDFINLRVENLDGCEVTSQVRVDLSFEVDIYFPNVFSPNNDENNDRFVLYNNGFPEMADDLKIFDRAGELIYTSSQTEFNETDNGWDGTFNGSPCQPGVYVFILEYTLKNGREKTLAGTITLVR